MTAASTGLGVTVSGVKKKARGSGRPGSSAVATRGSRPQSPEKCRMTGAASGVCQQTATMKRSRLTKKPKTLFSRP